MTAFSNEFLQDLPPKERRYDTPVGENLVFSVFPNGVKAWVHVYSYEGFVRRRTIGLFPEMEYAQAQAALSQSRRIVAVELQQGGTRQGARGMSRGKLALLTAGAVIGGIAVALTVRSLTGGSSAPETAVPVASVQTDAEPASSDTTPETTADTTVDDAAINTDPGAAMTPMADDTMASSGSAGPDTPPGSASPVPAISAGAAPATTDQADASIDDPADGAVEDLAAGESGDAGSPQTESPAAMAAAADDASVEGGTTDPVAGTRDALDAPTPEPETFGAAVGQAVEDGAVVDRTDAPDLEGSDGIVEQTSDESVDDAIEETEAAVEALPGAVTPAQGGDQDDAASESDAEPGAETNTEISAEPDTASPAVVPPEQATGSDAEPEPGAEPDTASPAVVPPEQATGSDAEPEPAAVSAPSVRAQLTSGLADMQPTDELVSPIAIAPGDTRRVYFFTETRAMTGMRITHRWQREGTTLTQLPFVVAGDPWPIYSSKEILAEQAGEWSVSILDEDGTVLASQTFQVSAEAP